MTKAVFSPMPKRRLEPLLREARKAYLKTDLAPLETLFKQQTRWLAKQTRANNQLARIRKNIDTLARKLAQPQGKLL